MERQRRICLRQRPQQGAPTVPILSDRDCPQPLKVAFPDAMSRTCFWQAAAAMEKGAKAGMTETELRARPRPCDPPTSSQIRMARKSISSKACGGGLSATHLVASTFETIAGRTACAAAVARAPYLPLTGAQITMILMLLLLLGSDNDPAC